jgi:hypothetical protein
MLAANKEERLRRAKQEMKQDLKRAESSSVYKRLCEMV